MLTQILKGLLVAGIFTTIMAAQPAVQIPIHFPEFELNGLWLVPISAPEYAGKVKDLLADDAALLAPLLPYSVILVNGSGRKLLGVGVEYSWRDTASGHPGGLQDVLTALSKGSESHIIPPGGIKIFTPSHAANMYLSITPDKRKAVPTSPSISLGVRLEDEILQDIGGLGPGGLTNFRVAIDSVIFEDHQYLGSSNVLQMLQRNHPEIHK